ncbi:MAG: outer membrane lipoprotein-sorting protein [Owenweeksia sp.]|nr:outer membrane lipoprotein-sorting protein [Owenweeksia sp.]
MQHLKAWSRGTEYGLICITAPARDEGIGFLKRDRVYNWVPEPLSARSELPPSMMMQSWMGSDFTNDDLVQESSLERDYTHELAGSQHKHGRPRTPGR